MSDQNTTPAADQGSATDTTPAKLYTTRAEAEGNKPANATTNHKVFEVSKAGATVGLIWARGYDNALALTARSEGYTASTSTSAPATKEAVAAKLATFTDDALAAMGLSRKKAKK